MSTPREVRDATGKAIAARLLAVVNGAYPPAELKGISSRPLHEVTSRFNLVARALSGPVPGAPGYEIEASPIGVAWLVTPAGIGILYNPIFSGRDAWIIPSNPAIYEHQAVAIAHQATRPVIGAVR